MSCSSCTGKLEVKKFGVFHAAKAVVTGRGYAEKDKIDKRIQVCNGCPDLNTISRQCKVCLCFVDLKAKFDDAHCPKEKW